MVCCALRSVRPVLLAVNPETVEFVLYRHLMKPKRGRNKLQCETPSGLGHADKENSMYSSKHFMG